MTMARSAVGRIGYSENLRVYSDAETERVRQAIEKLHGEFDDAGLCRWCGQPLHSVSGPSEQADSTAPDPIGPHDAGRE